MGRSKKGKRMCLCFGTKWHVDRKALPYPCTFVELFSVNMHYLLKRKETEFVLLVYLNELTLSCQIQLNVPSKVFAP